MTSSFAASIYQAPSDDAVAYLPPSAALEFRKGQIIYGQDRPSTSIYRVDSGKVKLSRIAENSSEILLEIVLPGELFGESAFLNGPRRAEQATALESATLIAWPVSVMEHLVTKQPRLAVSLLRISAQR